MRNRISAAVLLLIGASFTFALDNGLGKTPAMGWNTWNKYGCAISAAIVQSNADKLVALGLDKLGYTYVNIDDCWMLKDRDTQNHVQVDSAKFP